MPNVKITVLQRTIHEEIGQRFRDRGNELCPLFSDGQEF